MADSFEHTLQSGIDFPPTFFSKNAYQIILIKFLSQEDIVPTRPRIVRWK